MKIDETTLKAIKVVKEKIESKFDIEISEQELIDIVDSQFRGAVYGLKKGISVKLPVIGRFIFLDKKSTLEEIFKLNKVRDFYSEIEFSQKVLEGKIRTIKRNKERISKEKKTKYKVIDIIKKPNISGGHILYDALNEALKERKENGQSGII